jgi:hypothetical protein
MHPTSRVVIVGTDYRARLLLIADGKPSFGDEQLMVEEMRSITHPRAAYAFHKYLPRAGR